ncbi:Histidine-phosphotransfer domain HPT domain-containing [Mycena venus]|uniref:Histidine-phosphotransfer domain HPT domain-containing n=1 Tax=Mycena venus TaxID=2733690 RepID=A0A8H7D7S3_9AGAR|nr:Histidine-phosphotransfer domain HPT domain-containing [Mycena venus]
MVFSIMQASTSRTVQHSEVSNGIIDFAAFDQILELDDDETHAYSKDMISMYFAQAPAAFAGMDAALAATDLRTLADLAHFLMGSSATLGIARVAATCERIESLGEATLKADADAELEAGGTADDKTRDRDIDGDKESAPKQIAALLEVGKREYADAERWLRRWYADHGQGFDEDPTTKSAKPEGAAAPPRVTGSTEKSADAAAAVVVDTPPRRALQPTQEAPTAPPKDVNPSI